MVPRTTTAVSSPRVALLRGVNVGGKQVAMASLRDIAASLGFAQVSTLINSGNMVYAGGTHSTADDEHRLHDAIARELGVQCTVFVRSHAQLAAVLAACPFPQEAHTAPAKLLVTLWNAGTPQAKLEAFANAPVTVERFVLGAQALYCWLPDGISASVPYEKASRTLGDHITARNWSTMQKLLARMETLA